MVILRDGSTSDYISFNVLKICEGFITDLAGYDHTKRIHPYNSPIQNHIDRNKGSFFFHVLIISLA